ncbi:hypothetical protein R3P38DRAFT_3071087, partial [Favolaschia claudopus]
NSCLRAILARVLLYTLRTQAANTSRFTCAQTQLPHILLKAIPPPYLPGPESRHGFSSLPPSPLPTAACICTMHDESNTGKPDGGCPSRRDHALPG